MLHILFDNTDNVILGVFPTEQIALQFAQDKYPSHATWTQDAPNYLKKEADSNETK